MTIITLFSTDMEMDVSNFQLDHIITLIMTLIVLNTVVLEDVAPAALFNRDTHRLTWNLWKTPVMTWMCFYFAEHGQVFCCRDTVWTSSMSGLSLDFSYRTEKTLSVLLYVFTFQRSLLQHCVVYHWTFSLQCAKILNQSSSLHIFYMEPAILLLLKKNLEKQLSNFSKVYNNNNNTYCYYYLTQCSH